MRPSIKGSISSLMKEIDSEIAALDVEQRELQGDAPQEEGEEGTRSNRARFAKEGAEIRSELSSVLKRIQIWPRLSCALGSAAMPPNSILSRNGKNSKRIDEVVFVIESCESQNESVRSLGSYPTSRDRSDFRGCVHGSPHSWAIASHTRAIGSAKNGQPRHGLVSRTPSGHAFIHALNSVQAQRENQSRRFAKSPAEALLSTTDSTIDRVEISKMQLPLRKVFRRTTNERH